MTINEAKKLFREKYSSVGFTIVEEHKEELLLQNKYDLVVRVTSKNYGRSLKPNLAKIIS